MNKFNLRLLIFALVLAPFASAHAVCGPHYCSGFGSEVVVGALPYDNGDIWLEGPEIERDNLNCTLEDGKFMVLKSDHPGQDENYVTILTALALGNRLTIVIEEGTSNCKVRFAKIYY